MYSQNALEAGRKKFSSNASFARAARGASLSASLKKPWQQKGWREPPQPATPAWRTCGSLPRIAQLEGPGWLWLRSVYYIRIGGLCIAPEVRVDCISGSAWTETARPAWISHRQESCEIRKMLLVLLFASLLAIPLARQRRFHAPLFARLKVVGVTLDFLDDVLLLNLPLEPA